MTTTDRIAARYQTALEDHLGLEVTRDDDVLLVHAHGDRFLFDLVAGDPEYLRLSLGGTLETTLLPAELAVVTAESSRDTLGAKVVVREGLVIVSSEMVVAPPDCLPTVELLVGVVPRAISMVIDGVNRFVENQRVAEELAGIAGASALAYPDIA